MSAGGSFCIYIRHEKNCYSAFPIPIVIGTSFGKVCNGTFVALRFVNLMLMDTHVDAPENGDAENQTE